MAFLWTYILAGQERSMMLEYLQIHEYSNMGMKARYFLIGRRIFSGVQVNELIY